MYVDNVFAICPHGQATLKDFLHHPNSRYPNIELSMELERDCQLPFLDVLVIRCPDNSLGYATRKANHMDRYLQAASHHRSSHKRSIIITMMDSANSMRDEASWSSELQHVKLILQSNGYSLQHINRAFEPRPTKRKTNHRAYLPYIQETTEHISRLLKKQHPHDTESTQQNGI
jgi:hypothetical protein